ncbi:MAG: phosphate acyltransferase PlsX [Hymenobacteraceae bacterium]|nr:phosphate acyltransferase PlsX [Hymenobacteraceae bacterium]
MKIALDAMGGDFAPDAIVEGAVMAAKELPADAKVVLIGDQARLEAALRRVGAQPSPRLLIQHAAEVIEMGEHPTKALGQKPDSSIAVGYRLLKSGEVAAFCSAGNTGAMMVGALFSVKALPGVKRPPIAGFIPKTNGGTGVIVDVGANADCKPEMLEQFAEIGSIYAKYVLGIAEPRVALLNIGEEEGKGTMDVQEAYNLLKVNPAVRFVGNIEGRDIFLDKCDVIVCDGFTGNVALKMAESIYDIMVQRGLKDPYFDRYNYEAIGGSPILGINGNVVIGHGVSSPLAACNMVKLGYQMSAAGVLERFRRVYAAN